MVNYIIGSGLVLILIMGGVIHHNKNEIELLKSELKNKNNEIIKEIEICNNSKELEALKRQNDNFKRIFDDAIISRNAAERQLENYKNDLQDLEKDFNEYKNKEIKCLNEQVDKKYLKTIKGVINGKN